MSCSKSVRWLKKKRSKFLAKMAGSMTDKQVHALIVDEGRPDFELGTKFLLLANFGLANGVSRSDILKLLGGDYIVSIILPLARPFSIVVFSDERQASARFLLLADQKTSTGDVFPFFLSSLPVFKEASVDLTEGVFPEGLKIMSEVISEEEENLLINFVQELRDLKPIDSSLKQRKAWHFGFTFDYSLNQVSDGQSQPLPSMCSELLFPKLLQRGLITEVPDQLTINEYEPGDGIPYHIESSAFGEEVVSISLMSPIVMELRSSNYAKTSFRPHVSILLETRSALVLTGESRHSWEHGIPGRKSELIVENNNGSYVTRFVAPKESEIDLVIPQSGLSLGTLHRKRRISLTFRKVVQLTPEPYKIPSKPIFCQDPALSTHLEQNFVRDVYDTVAQEFSSTRHTPWPKVADFVRSLPEGSIIADVGCGNGRYFGVNRGIFTVGSDSCEHLLQLASQVSHQASVFIGDCCCLPFRDESFDAAMCIAVIHHLASESRRTAAVDEIFRILRRGGRALIYVWAVEQSDELTGVASTYTANFKDNNGCSDQDDTNVVTVNGLVIPVHHPRTPFSAARPDCFVPWKRNSLRYYHVFQRGELESLFLHCRDKITFSKRYFDEGNWCVEFIKN